jgi:hypothetical protein
MEPEVSLFGTQMLALVRILSQLSPANVLTHYFFVVHSIIIVPSSPRFFQLNFVVTVLTVIKINPYTSIKGYVRSALLSLRMVSA